MTLIEYPKPFSPTCTWEVRIPIFEVLKCSSGDDISHCIPIKYNEIILDESLKNESENIVSRISNQISNLKAKNEQPAFIVLGRRSYKVLAYRLGGFPTEFRGLPIVVIPIASNYCSVSTDAKNAFIKMETRGKEGVAKAINFGDKHGN